MQIRWPNGSLIVGRLMWLDGYGVSLAYGNLSLIGEDVREGDRIFVYAHTWVWCTGLDLMVAGSLPKAIRRRLGFRIYRWMTR